VSDDDPFEFPPEERDAGRNEGRARRDEGMKRAADHSPTEKEILYEVAKGIARYSAKTGKPFQADDIWRVSGLTVREGRVLGPVMRDLRRAGLAAPTGKLSKGYRPQNHVRPQELWKGLP